MYLVLSVTVGNRGSLEVVTLGTPKINGEMGEEAKTGRVRAFSTLSGLALRPFCHPKCRPNIDLAAHLSPFSEAYHVLYLCEPIYPMKCKPLSSPHSAGGNGRLGEVKGCARGHTA